MSIIEPAIRPPAEADSFLLQVTLGCSADTCTFCAPYKKKPFRIKDCEEINADIERYARRHRNTRRVFLMDGDAVVVSNSKLIPILKKLGESFPYLSRVSSYANGYSIIKRSNSELKELYDYRLRLIYMGLESGSQDVLNNVRKVSTVKEMIEAVNKAAEAQIKSSIIVLLGVGGEKYSREHVKGTIEALNKMQPRYLSFLSLMVVPGTPLAEEVKRGEFKELTPLELLKEAYQIISSLELKKTIFRSNHASNYLSLEGSFPKDKDKLLNTLNSAINGNVDLRSESLRGL